MNFSCSNTIKASTRGAIFASLDTFLYYCSYWRINFSRVEWHVLKVDGRYQKDPAFPHEDNWVWSPQVKSSGPGLILNVCAANFYFTLPEIVCTNGVRRSVFIPCIVARER